MVLSLKESLDLKPSKIVFGGTEASILDIAEGLKKRYSDTISVVHSFSDIPLLMVTTAQATKPVAIGKLLSPQRISLDNVVAIGDDIPDFEMLRECGISIAMANAIPGIKEICVYRTASNDDDGVAVVLEHILGNIKK